MLELVKNMYPHEIDPRVAYFEGLERSCLKRQELLDIISELHTEMLNVLSAPTLDSAKLDDIEKKLGVLKDAVRL